MMEEVIGEGNTSTVVTCLHPSFELPSPHETTPWIRQSPDDFVTWPKGDLLLRDTPFLANDFQRGLYQASDSGAKGDEGVFRRVESRRHRLTAARARTVDLKSLTTCSPAKTAQLWCACKGWNA
ncbi:hypothetical protein CDAR_483241 [Caerostris darwini]|uniref:Uncharacterized protein n=1 Tax=Caerostris darwini TaxID=1538125 RepID=A0AAV4V4Q0_9ARAC|nr:hypothetical protein CDAR_483241 [Caerostris darwini]